MLSELETFASDVSKLGGHRVLARQLFPAGRRCAPIGNRLANAPPLPAYGGAPGRVRTRPSVSFGVAVMKRSRSVTQPARPPRGRVSHRSIEPLPPAPTVVPAPPTAPATERATPAEGGVERPEPRFSARLIERMSSLPPRQAESALEIAAFVGRMLAARRSPNGT